MAAPDKPDPFDVTPADALGSARTPLSAAVALGTPALRGGDPRGAYEIYAAAARVVGATVTDARPATAEVASALDHSDHEPDPRVRAGLLHTLFRELLGNYPDPAGLDDPPDYAAADAADPSELVHGFLTQAVSLGEQARAMGSERGCYEVFAATARMVLTTVVGATALARLQGALDEASAARAEPRKAAVMRRAFDEILAQTCIRRGPAVTRREMRLMLSMAMQIGTPAYNMGDHRGCYETYACCARLLSRVAPEPAAIALRAALSAAAIELDVSEQAWILRRAFDSLIGCG